MVACLLTRYKDEGEVHPPTVTPSGFVDHIRDKGKDEECDGEGHEHRVPGMAFD